jgi:hypothetical protein
MAFDAAVRNTLGALAAVEEKGVQAATTGLGKLSSENTTKADPPGSSRGDEEK